MMSLWELKRFWFYILFKYCANMEICGSFKSFGFIFYLNINDNDEFEFNLDLLEIHSLLSLD